MIKKKVKYRTDKHRRVMEFGFNKAKNENQFSFTYTDLDVLNISNKRKIVNELVDDGKLFRYGTKNKAILVVANFDKYYLFQNAQKIRNSDVDTVEQIVRDHKGFWSSLLIHNLNITIKHPNTMLYDSIIERGEKADEYNYGIIKKSKDGSTFQFYPCKTIIQYRSSDNPVTANYESLDLFLHARLLDLYNYASCDVDLCIPAFGDWIFNAVDVHRDLRYIHPKPSFKPMNVTLPNGIKYVIYIHKEKYKQYGRFEFQLKPHMRTQYIFDYIYSFDPIIVENNFSLEELEKLKEDIVSDPNYYVYDPPDPLDPDYYKKKPFTPYNEEEVYENKAFS